MPQRTPFEDDKLVIFSDYVCPFCFLGKASLENYLEETGESVETEWRPFDLQGHKRGPDGEIQSDVSDGKDEAYFEKARENVRRLQAEYDVEMTDELRRDVDSWNAHKAALYARDEASDETFQAFNDAIFDALWLDGRDIGDVDVLVELAETCGLDGDDIRQAVESSEYDERVRDAFAESKQVGIRGVPTFFFDGQGMQGAVPPEQLQILLQE